MTHQKIGYCKECGTEVTQDCYAPEYDIYECPVCGHPHSKSELWDERPDYVDNHKDARLSSKLVIGSARIKSESIL